MYGVGIINGESIGHEPNANRPKHYRGPLIIDGETFDAASGSGRAWGCPYGTYILTPQPPGSIIKRLYQRVGIAHSRGLKLTWNVGIPGKITSIGFDPAAGRQRRSIQIHCSPSMKSSGCIVMDLGNFQEFSALMSKKRD